MKVFIILVTLASLGSMVKAGCTMHPPCNADQTTCSSGPPGPDGCLPPPLCLPQNPPSPSGVKCPTNCPVSCKVDEVYCPGIEDDRGCRFPDMCLPQAPGQACRPVCPVSCKSSEIMCSSGITGGCPGLNFCVPNSVRIGGKKCANYCPLNCGSMFPCPMVNGPDGCPLPMQCAADPSYCPK